MRPLALTPFLLILAASLAAAQTSKPSLQTPALSPDGKEIAFASGGDIWTAPTAGGEAHLLISDPADESRPLYSPDGTKLAFISTRSGLGDIYILTLATGDLARLTFSDSLSNLDGWSRDGQWIYFTSSTTDVPGQSDILRALPGRNPGRAAGQGHLVCPMVAQRPRPHRRNRALAQAARLAFAYRCGLPPSAAGRRQACLAHVVARRQQPLLHVRQERRGRHQERAGGER